jgi:hypothetical protein
MKQILTQTSPSLLSTGISAVSYMLSAVTLSNTNNAKILELDDELAASLREAAAGHTELDAATFSSDEIDALTGALMRLAKMIERRDMSAWMEEDEGGKRSSAWDIVCALLERGRLGRKEEEKASHVEVEEISPSLTSRTLLACHSRNHIAFPSRLLESCQASQHPLCDLDSGRRRLAAQAA